MLLLLPWVATGKTLCDFIASTCLWGCIVETNWIFEHKPPPHFRHKVVGKMTGRIIRRLWYEPYSQVWNHEPLCTAPTTRSLQLADQSFSTSIKNGLYKPSYCWSCSSLLPRPLLSRGKWSGDYWAISWLYWLSSIDFEWTLITCLHDVRPISLVMHMLI